MKPQAKLLVLISAASICCTLSTCSRAKQKHEESELSQYSMRQRELENIAGGGVAQRTKSETSAEQAQPQNVQPASTAAAPPAESVARQRDSSARYQALLAGLTIFVLAIFVGFEVITKVPPTLHTPLMSGSNAISGITIVGAVIVAGIGFKFSAFVGMIAVILATINVVGGFLVTHRMLAMFKKR